MSSPSEAFSPAQLRGLVGDSMPAIVRLVRNAAGAWTFHFNLNGAALLPDGREVIVNRVVRVRATDTKGRRKPAGS